MDSSLFFLAAVAAILAIYGNVNCQSSTCLEIQSCMTPEFNAAIKNTQQDSKEKICRIFRDVINCMNPKIEECLPSLSDPNMAAMFTNQRDQMKESLTTRCGDEGMTEGDDGTSSAANCASDMQACMGPMTDAAGGGDIGAMCKKIKQATDCLAGLKSSCPANMANAIETAANQLKQSGAACEGAEGEDGGDMSGCRMEDFTKCGADQSEADEKEACKKLPEIEGCFSGLKKKCTMKAFQDVIMKGQESFKKIRETCKEKGYTIGSGGNSLTASYFLAAAATVLLAGRLHF